MLFVNKQYEKLKNTELLTTVDVPKQTAQDILDVTDFEEKGKLLPPESYNMTGLYLKRDWTNSCTIGTLISKDGNTKFKAISHAGTVGPTVRATVDLDSTGQAGAFLTPSGQVKIATPQVAYAMQGMPIEEADKFTETEAFDMAGQAMHSQTAFAYILLMIRDASRQTFELAHCIPAPEIFFPFSGCDTRHIKASNFNEIIEEVRVDPNLALRPWKLNNMAQEIDPYPYVSDETPKHLVGRTPSEVYKPGIREKIMDWFGKLKLYTKIRKDHPRKNIQPPSLLRIPMVEAVHAEFNMPGHSLIMTSGKTQAAQDYKPEPSYSLENFKKNVIEDFDPYPLQSPYLDKQVFQYLENGVPSHIKKPAWDIVLSANSQLLLPYLEIIERHTLKNYVLYISIMSAYVCELRFECVFIISLYEFLIWECRHSSYHQHTSVETKQ